MLTYKVLKRGNKGTQVYILQALLRAAHFLGKNGKVLEIDGSFGPQTQYAVDQFHKINALYTCGTVDDSKWTLDDWYSLLGATADDA